MRCGLPLPIHGRGSPRPSLRLNFHFSVGKYCTGNSIQHSDSP